MTSCMRFFFYLKCFLHFTVVKNNRLAAYRIGNPGDRKVCVFGSSAEHTKRSQSRLFSMLSCLHVHQVRQSLHTFHHSVNYITPHAGDTFFICLQRSYSLNNLNKAFLRYIYIDYFFAHLGLAKKPLLFQVSQTSFSIPGQWQAAWFWIYLLCICHGTQGSSQVPHKLPLPHTLLQRQTQPFSNSISQDHFHMFSPLNRTLLHQSSGTRQLPGLPRRECPHQCYFTIFHLETLHLNFLLKIKFTTNP